MERTKSSPLETRREADRSIEDTEAYKGAETLTQLGVLTKMKDIELFHGRAGQGGEWQVRSDFNNSGNQTGHHNINKIPALNTGSLTTARDFARARATGSEQPVAEVYRIKSSNPDARVIDSDFDWGSLSKFQYQDAIYALRKTLPDVADGTTLDFEDRNSGLGRAFSLKNLASGGEYGYLTVSDDVGNIANRLHVRPEMVQKLSGARNVRHLLGTQPEFMRQILYAFSDNEDSIQVRFESGDKSIPIDREYIGNWLKNMDAVGMGITVHSATLGRTLKNHLLFELDDVNTEERLEKNREVLKRRMGNMALRIYSKLNRSRTEANPGSEMSEAERRRECEKINGELDRYFCSEITRVGKSIGMNIENGMDTHDWTDPDQLRRLLNAIKQSRGEQIETGETGTKRKSEIIGLLSENLYASPQDIVEAAKKTPGFKGIFEADSGVWEGFSVQQHTETTLQFLDDNYADKLPSGVLPLLRLALVTHDIGKGVAARNGDKKRQKSYNIAYAEDFLRKNGVDDDLRELVITMIGDGMDASTDWAVHGGSSQKFYVFCKRTVGNFLGTVPSHDDVYGFAQMELALQTCDSGAYTDMAITRQRINDSSYFNYRNSPSFNSSFVRKASLSKRRAALKRRLD